jgi:hypothetical protein
MKRFAVHFLPLCVALQLPLFTAHAWNETGHRLVNELAVASLPADFPAFARSVEASNRIAFLGGEADRWRNTPELGLKHVNGPDHYIDLEELDLYGLSPETLPPLRYDFIAKLALARAAHPDKFPPIDPSRNLDHTRELTGLLPWAIAEQYAKLKSEFSYLKAFETAGGTPEEIANARANIIYTMGVMGHYVADATQPLHTTMHFNGWAGPNPEHYTTNRTFHAWIDGGYIAKTKIPDDFAAMTARLHPAQIPELHGKPMEPGEMFETAVAFLQAQNKLVEPLYRMEKEHKLTGDPGEGMEGKPFIEGQLVKGGQMLGDIWYAAWKQAPPDTYLARTLERRHQSKDGGE